MAAFLKRQSLSKKTSFTASSKERHTGNAAYEPTLHTVHSKDMSIVSDTAIFANSSLSQIVEPHINATESLHRDFLQQVRSISDSASNPSYFAFDADNNDTTEHNNSDSEELVLDIQYTPSQKKTDITQKTLKYYSLDDALKSLQFGQFDYILICIVSVIYFSMVIQEKITKIMYCLIVNHNFIFEIPYNAELLLYVAFQSGGFIGIFLCTLPDKFGRKRVIHYSSIALMIFAILQIFAYNWIMLISSRFFIGSCCYSAMISSLVLLIEYVPNSNRFRVIYFIFFIGIISYAIGSLIAYAIYSISISSKAHDINTSDWRLLLCILSIPVWILPILIYLFLPESPHFVALQGDKEQVMKLLKTIEIYNKHSFFNILEQQSLTVQSFDRIDKKSRGKIAALFTLEAYKKSSILLCCISFAIWFIQSTIYETQHLFVAVDNIQSKQVLNNMRVSRNFGFELAVTVCDIIAALCVLLFLHFMDRKRLLMIGFKISTIMLFIVMIVILLKGFGFIYVIGIISSLIANISIGCCAFVVQIYILEYYCTVIRTISLGFIYYGIGSIALLLSFSVTLLFDTQWVIVMCYVICSVIGFICCRLLDTETKNKPLEDHITNTDHQKNVSSKVHYDYVAMT